MTTMQKLDKLANDLFKVDYVKLSKTQEKEVFAHYLAKYAVSVQPKSRSFERYSQLIGK